MDLPTPLLVTGVPRSGTTWLARTLAAGPRTAMPGREPMNPRGRQFALGGTVDGWVRLQHPEPRQTRLLRRVYRGLEPRTLSRYGIRQLTAAAPWTRTIVKDPFAMLSIPTVVRVTGARPLLLYRNPSAVLASYRRMGWRADLDEVIALGARAPTATDADLAEASAMAVFWCFLNNAALDDIAELPQATVVSHESLIHGDHTALAQLRSHLGLRPATARRNEPAPTPQTATALHRFGRGRDEVLHGWRPLLSPAETAHMELLTADTLDRLERARLRLSPELPSDSTRGTR
jgi:hypothetical protein